MTIIQSAKALIAAYLMDGAAAGSNKGALDVVNRWAANLHDFIKAADDGMAATATAETDFAMADGPGKAIQAYLIPTNATGLVANDVNFATVIIRGRDAARANPVILAQQTTKITGGSGNWARGVRVNIPLNTGVDLSTIDGGSLTIEITKSGAGVVVPAFRAYLFVSPE